MRAAYERAGDGRAVGAASRPAERGRARDARGNRLVLRRLGGAAGGSLRRGPLRRPHGRRGAGGGGAARGGRGGVGERTGERVLSAGRARPRGGPGPVGGGAGAPGRRDRAGG